MKTSYVFLSIQGFNQMKKRLPNQHFQTIVNNGLKTLRYFFHLLNLLINLYNFNNNTTHRLNELQQINKKHIAS